MKNFILTILLILALGSNAEGKSPDKNLWMITFYCACDICITEPANRDGLTASGFPLHTETKIAANNFLPFGTYIHIEGFGNYVICDRGSIKYFGRAKDRVKHIDIYVPDHQQAKELGVQYKNVEVLQ